MQNPRPIRLQPEDKLHTLRRLDVGKPWYSLDDRRYCTSCHKTITGRQIEVLGGTRGLGQLRLSCPTERCASTPADWIYPRAVPAFRAQAHRGITNNNVVTVRVAKRRGEVVSSVSLVERGLGFVRRVASRVNIWPTPVQQGSALFYQFP